MIDLRVPFNFVLLPRCENKAIIRLVNSDFDFFNLFFIFEDQRVKVSIQVFES